MAREIAFHRHAETIIVAIGKVPQISGEQFADYLDGVRASFEKDGVCAAFFTFSPTTAPTPAQRKQLTESAARFGGTLLRYNVFITDSAFVRGAVTAMNWVLPDKSIKAFPPTQVDRAFDWLTQAGHRYDRVVLLRSLAQLLADVGYPPDYVTRVLGSGH